MRVVWNRRQLMIQMSVDDAKVLLEWLQKIGMEPGSVPDLLRSRLTDGIIKIMCNYSSGGS